MIRLGIVDCDTSHVVAFTQRLNHLEIAEEQWVEGAQVVAAGAPPFCSQPRAGGALHGAAAGVRGARSSPPPPICWAR